jgi:hypothetical protein
MEKHSDKCYDYVSGTLKDMDYTPRCRRLSEFLFALNEVFCRIFQGQGETFYAVLLYIGPAENADKYKYEIKFVNEDDTEGVAVMHLTRSFNENLDDVFKSGNCGKLHYDVVQRLETRQRRVKYKIEIFRVGA